MNQNRLHTMNLPYKRIVFLLLFLVTFGKQSIAQSQNYGVQLFPLGFNQTLYAASKGKLLVEGEISFNPLASRRNAGDTLDLPFFDDFTSTLLYPDQRMWQDSQVYISSGFPVSPPSYGVAVFDNLDKFGKPYTSTFSINTFGPWDTLTSLPINLLTYKVGLNDIPYSLADSIYLSFFFQGGGLGDRPEQADSLVLQFRNKNGQWKSVWNVFGIGNTAFKQVIIGVLDEDYLWEAFQFRFVSYTFAMGNLNQVLLDYVRMNRNRNVNDTIIRDVAINKKPWSLLNTYHAMPYNHYLEASTSYTATNHKIGVRNSDIDVINTQFQFEAYHKLTQLALFPFANSSRNILANSDSSETFNNFNFISLPTNEYVRIRNVYKINPQAGNTTPSGYNSIGNNDEYISFQDFKNYYAYDDGSAEGGIGLSYEGLPPGRGAFALKYIVTKTDTLSAISVFFNRSLESVTSRPFKLSIWGNLTEGTSTDVPIYEMNVLAPTYTDSINGFHDYELDTLIVLPAGTYYFGWTQTAIFNLNVGYDNNYRMGGIEQRNTNILFNMVGVWSYADASVRGTPMIRPIMGEYSTYGLNVPKVSNRNSFVKNYTVYPNPTNGLLQVSYTGHETSIAEYTIKTIEGKSIMFGVIADKIPIDISRFAAGVYFIEIRNEGLVQIEKIIKQ